MIVLTLTARLNTIFNFCNTTVGEPLSHKLAMPPPSTPVTGKGEKRPLGSSERKLPQPPDKKAIDGTMVSKTLNFAQASASTVEADLQDPNAMSVLQAVLLEVKKIDELNSNVNDVRADIGTFQESLTELTGQVTGMIESCKILKLNVRRFPSLKAE